MSRHTVNRTMDAISNRAMRLIPGVCGAGCEMLDRTQAGWRPDRLVMKVTLESEPGTALMLHQAETVAGSAYRVVASEVIGLGGCSRLEATLVHRRLPAYAGR